MEQTAAPAKRRYCLKCGYDAETAAIVCPQCHRRLRTTTETRISGLFQTFGGALLIGLMGYILFWMIDMVREGDQARSRFTGTEQQLMVIFGIFAFVILFGLVSFIFGLFQLITGKRNKLFIWLVAVLAFILLIGAVYVILKF